MAPAAEIKRAVSPHTHRNKNPAYGGVLYCVGKGGRAVGRVGLKLRHLAPVPLGHVGLAALCQKALCWYASHGNA